MVVLTFTNIAPNESLQVGDLAYYIQNLNTNFENTGFMTGDELEASPMNSDLQPVSTMVLIGTISSIQIDNDPDQNTNEPDIPTTSQLTIYVEEPSAGINPPTANDFIFFVKDNLVELSSVTGYYSKVVMKNNSPNKAQLYNVSCEVAESSK